MNPSCTNDVILRSIPLNRKMKRYWISKYKRIVANCGQDEAVRKFKQLRIAVLSYISDKDRRTNLSEYYAQTGFRVNGYLRMLFEYADTQPHFILNFLSLYTASVKSTQSPDQAAIATHQRLKSVKSQTGIPKFMKSWLGYLRVSPSRTYRFALRHPESPFHRYAIHHSKKDWCSYWSSWRWRLSKGWQSNGQFDYDIFPEVYKDYDPSSLSSDSYDQDFADLISMHMSEDSPLTDEELDFVDHFLNDEVGDALFAVLWGETQGFEDLFSKTGLLSGTYVGHVHHIHKKGSGTALRDIAVPNRFIQKALVPAADRLYNLLRWMPKDATFDQSKFDIRIENRVTNDNLYQGSVDLSKATDNLPFEWGAYIIDFMIRKFPKMEFSKRKSESDFASEDALIRSWDLFKTVARSSWEDEGFLTKWTVGQPLGSLPSFAVLGITHNIFVEALSLSLGLGHSPYAILGDDIVIFNKKLRSHYIRELTSRAIPLSLHKSYEGRLSEFAGSIFVKNCIPFHTPDHSPISWQSVFDWQRASGIRIPWSNLPRKIRSRFLSKARKELEDSGKEPSLMEVKRLASSSYALCQTCLVQGRGSHLYPIPDNEVLAEEIAGFFERTLDNDHPIPDGVRHSGITLLGSRHPVVLMNERFADKDGYFLRYRPVELPSWYKEKFRPCATDAAIDAAIASCLETTSKDTIYKWLHGHL